MLVNLAQDIVLASDERFEAWHGSPQEFTKNFALTDGLSVKFDGASASTMRAKAVLPVSGRPFYRLTPVDMGASRWLTLERGLNVAALRDLSELVPVLNASAVRSVSLFALLRITFTDNRFTDTSSVQIELRREPRARSLPISLDDLPVDALTNPKSAKLIFFIEARDVDIDFYGLEIFGVPTPDAETTPDDVASLRERALAGASTVRHRALDASTVVEPGRIDGFREFAEGVNVDVDADGGQYVAYAVKKDLVTFDYSTAAGSRWRTIEFRFTDIPVSDGLTALVSVAGSAQGDARWTSIPMLVRRYGVDDWTDSPLAAVLEVESKAAHSTATIDVKPLLADDQDVQTFGVLLFVPETCRALQFSTLEAVLYDRQVNVPAATETTTNPTLAHSLRATVRRAAVVGKTLKSR